MLILGKSGTGKSTLLHLLSGLIKPNSGDVVIDGMNINSYSDRALDKFRGEKIGLVFQKAHFVKSLSLKENLLLAQKLGGLKQDSKAIETTLESLNIADKINKRASEISVGEQQRASIARAILTKPSLILADEPTSALDDENAFNVANLLKKNADECNASLIIVTHDQRIKEKFTKSIEL